MLDFFNYMITHLGMALFIIGLVFIIFIGWQIAIWWNSDNGAYGKPTTKKITDEEIKKAIHRVAAKRRLKYAKKKMKRTNAS